MALSYLNASYSVFAYAVNRYAGISVCPPLPPAISIELSSICNLACPECLTGTGLTRRRNPFMSFDLAENIASQLRGHVLSAWLSFQGEPMMHPDFFRIAGLFEGMNPVVSTNGHWFDRESCIRLAGSPLKKIIISYDGVTPEAYGIYRRGGDHTLVSEGIRRLAEVIRDTGSELKIVLQFLVHRGNEHETNAAATFARSVGAGFRVKTMQVLDHTRAGEWAPSGKGMSRYYMGDDGAWHHLRSPARGCMRMWTSAVITTDGDVVPCCYDKNGRHVMGNLEEQSFREIWRGERYRSFRRMVMKDRNPVDICSCCSQGRQLFGRS
ncbi:MAG: SPASM domain-containing protein [Bacteroidales bacterium]|jgi:radical SAM protein with 4Fe4S-binding SPASM domain|nr:SPASM domain-containing protein [Bacteroidales bacterium]